jgi:hypothetical protein
LSLKVAEHLRALMMPPLSSSTERFPFLSQLSMASKSRKDPTAIYLRTLLLFRV